jgi:aryl-alcohol dehydrogenase-like predicted oxidoreductase
LTPASRTRRAQSTTSAKRCEGLGDAVKAGKIRAVGLSNESAWGTMQFVRLAEEHNLPRVASIQNEYNLICRLFDTDMAEVAHHEDVGLLAFSPLATGILSGKYQGGAARQARAAPRRKPGWPLETGDGSRGAGLS